MKTTTQEVKFTVTDAERELVKRLAIRANKLAQELGARYSVIDAEMDLRACHASGCPLDFAAMLAADNGNFGHDAFGIRRHLDRNTGQLGDCFLPRFALPQS